MDLNLLKQLTYYRHKRQIALLNLKCHRNTISMFLDRESPNYPIAVDATHQMLTALTDLRDANEKIELLEVKNDNN